MLDNTQIPVVTDDDITNAIVFERILFANNPGSAIDVTENEEETPEPAILSRVCFAILVLRNGCVVTGSAVDYNAEGDTDAINPTVLAGNAAREKVRTIIASERMGRVEA